MNHLKMNRLLLGLVSMALLVAVGCGDDDENNVTVNNQTTNNQTTNNQTTNNQTTNNETTPTGTARLQVIHNAPDPGAASVDVFVNGELHIDDFAFRTATGFVEVPAGVPLNVDIAPPSASDGDGADARINPEGAFSYTLTADSYTTIVASGVLDPTEFADNPDGADTAFDLIRIDNQKVAPDDASTIEVRVLHGAPDAPAVDAVPAGAAEPLVDGAQYGDYSDYLPVPGGDIVPININADADDSFVAAYQTTGGVAGLTAVAAASGFLDPSTNQNGPAFGLYVFLGADAEDTETSAGIPLPQAARAQIIHNSADPAAAEVDVFINGAEAVPGLAFRSATPYVTLPSGVSLTVDIAAAADGNTAADRVHAEDAFVFADGLDAGSSTAIVANGFLTPGDFEPNPSQNDTAFNLYAIDGQEASTNVDEFQFNTFHGASDAPAVDVAVMPAGDLLIDNLAYGEATGFQGVAGDTYTLELRAAGTTTAVQTYTVPAVAFVGQAGIVVASGFLTPDDGTDPDTPFSLLLFLPGGGEATPVPTE